MLRTTKKRKPRHLARERMRISRLISNTLSKEQNRKVLTVLTIVLAITAQLSTPILGVIPNGSMVTAATGNVYYVSPNGNDSNTGSESSPFRTISRAEDVARAGDTVYVRGGTYNETVTHGHSGVSGAPITFRNYPGENPILNGGNSRSRAFDFNGQDWIVVNGFEITNYNGGSSHNGVFHATKSGTNDITITNCYVHDINGDNSGHAVRAQYATRLTITSNRFVDVDGKGIYLEYGGGGHVISKNELGNIDHDAIYYNPYGINSRVTISHNWFHDAPTTASDHVDAIQIQTSASTPITNADIQIHHNKFRKFHNHFMIIKYVGAATVYNNLFWGGLSRAASVDWSAVGIRLSGSSGTKVFNNTFAELNTYGSAVTGINVAASDGIPSKNCSVYNNIVLDSGSAIKSNGQSGYRGGNNITSGDKTALFVDPGKAKDFRLRPSSKAIDTGYANTDNHLSYPPTDLDLKARIANGQVDIGAYEYGATSGTTPPADSTTPPADGTTPPADGTTPPADDTAPSQDTVAPTVSISTPASGATIEGMVKAVAEAIDNVEVRKIELYIDGARNTTTPNNYDFVQYDPTYDFFIDTTKLTDGVHTLKAIAYDTSDNTASTEVTVNVKNTAGDTTPVTPPPVPDITAPVTVVADPAEGKLLAGTEKLISGTTTDDVAVDKVEVAIQKEDGTYWDGSGWSNSAAWLPAEITSGAGTKTVTWNYLWHMPESDGLSYVVKARGTDASGNVEDTAVINVQVDNVAPKGSITIDSGAESTTGKEVTITNSITGASKMRFSVDGLAWTDWEEYANSKTLTLTDGFGVKTIKGQFSDNTNIYETSDSIELREPAANLSVTYPAGWNQVTSPTGTEIGVTLYEYDAASKDYKTVDSPVTGAGYWAYFDKPTTVSIKVELIDTFEVKLQQGWNMVGNPFDRDITLPSGYKGYSYDTSVGGYETAGTIAKGKGIWVWVSDAQTLTLHR